MNRYNNNGEMIDASKLNRSVIAQEIIIERINAMIESELGVHELNLATN